MEENLFPSAMIGESVRALEEERRLFYVAITRAEEHCFLSYAKTRFRFGKMEFGSPSRFLKDIDVRFLHLPNTNLSFRMGEDVHNDFSYKKREEGMMRPKQQVISPAVPRNLKRVMPASDSAGTTSQSGVSISGVMEGQLIEHERFGIGEVLKMEGEGDNAKATIRFKNAGDKQLLLRFARFKVIG